MITRALGKSPRIAISASVPFRPGKAPEVILATHLADGPAAAHGTASTRPLCAYPLIAKYKGTGSTDAATNFVCGMKTPKAFVIEESLFVEEWRASFKLTEVEALAAVAPEGNKKSNLKPCITPIRI